MHNSPRWITGLLLLIFLASLTCPVAAAVPSLTLWSPSAYQVFQRRGNSGAIHIVGEVRPASSDAPWTVSADWNGVNAITVTTRVIDFILDAPAGQGTLTVTVAGVSQSIPLVGIGEVFIIAGQSNAMGYGFHMQTYSHPTLKAGLLGNDYFWKELKDPTDSAARQIDTVSSDLIAAGSYYPLLATLLMQDQGVPVAFVPCAKASSGIDQWLRTDPLDRKTLYGSCLNRMMVTGGVRAILWWQGETEANTTSARRNLEAWAYARQLETLADAYFEDAHVPLVVTLLEDRGHPDTAAKINAGMRIAASRDPHVLLGADLSDLPTDDGTHIKSDAGLQEVARREWAVLKPLFFSG